jgi:hypothetical protein
MKQAAETFRTVVLGNRVIALRQLAEFVRVVSLEPMLPEIKCVALESLLTCCPTDSKSLSQLMSFRGQGAALMSLNPLEQARFALVSIIKSAGYD